MNKNLNKAIKIIAILPYTRMIALTGSYAEKRARPDSDIDLFIQVKEGRIWTARLIVTLAIALAGIRRTDSNKAGRICLNWFATYNAPEKQKGRVYQIVWADRSTHQQTNSNIKSIIEFLITPLQILGLEKFVRYWQIKRIEADPRTSQPGSSVRFNDRELGFHPLKAK